MRTLRIKFPAVCADCHMKHPPGTVMEMRPRGRSYDLVCLPAPAHKLENKDKVKC